MAGLGGRPGVDRRYGNARFRFDVTMELVIAGSQLINPKGLSFSKLTAEHVVADLQQAALQQLEDTYRRRNVLTKRLERAIRAPGSYRVEDTEIYMFNRKFMDNAVPYWLAIDQGTNWFVERRRILHGYWLDAGGPNGFSRTTGRQGRLLRPNALPGQGHPVYDVGSWRMNQRHSGRAAGRLGADSRSTATRGQIKVPILAHNFVDAARRRFREVDVNTLAHDVLTQLVRARGLLPR